MQWSLLLEVAADEEAAHLDGHGPMFDRLVDLRAAYDAASAIAQEGRPFSVRLTVEGADDLWAVVGQVLSVLDAARRRMQVEAWPTTRVGEVVQADELARDISEATFPDVVGTSEATKMLGVSRQRLQALRKLKLFPRPVVTLAAGPLWLRSAVEAFAASWERDNGRPYLPQEMRAVVDEEMNSIPRGSLEQNMFRSAYRNARFHGPGSHATIDATPEAAYGVALRMVRTKSPGFEPEILPALLPEAVAGPILSTQVRFVSGEAAG